MSLISHEPIIIGIDHGYGNIKTAHYCFKTGVTSYDHEPLFRRNMLVHDGHYYIIGDEHKEFSADKAQDQDYYILTLVAIALELDSRDLTSACVYLAAGLPLTWVSGQKDSFKSYLLQHDTVDFSFRGVDYHVEFAGAAIYPQGFSAVADRLRDFHGVNMLCDIGTGTMNIMYINNGKPIPSQCFTGKYGTYQCILTVREKLMREFGKAVDDTVIENVLRHGEADIGKRYLEAIQERARAYAAGIMRRLRDHEYDVELMKLYVMGGGSCLIKNFADYDKSRVTVNDNICATAKGYERLAENALRKNGGSI